MNTASACCTCTEPAGPCTCDATAKGRDRPPCAVDCNCETCRSEDPAED